MNEWHRNKLDRNQYNIRVAQWRGSIVIQHFVTIYIVCLQWEIVIIQGSRLTVAN